MKDWKTTITGIVGLIAILVAKFGVSVSVEVQVAIVTVIVFILSYFSSDRKK